uniref:BRO1 domain-containing protein n=1 Tax=Ditylenchus dipsaci TaxID=166011 RepID=A0A915EQJ8_9BILA
MFLSYYYELTMIEKWVPMALTQDSISFKWKDAFSNSFMSYFCASAENPNISYERVAVVFNYGPLMSKIAAFQNVGTDKIFKVIRDLFQQAAGVFLKLRDSVIESIQQAPTQDLKPDTLDALSSSMLAQAQEKWHDIVSAKAISYAAIAQYHQSNVEGESMNIEQKFVRLEKANRLIKEGRNIFSLGDHFSEKETVIKKSLTKLADDLEKIVILFLVPTNLPNL